jgi:hypothetical protein
VGRADLPLEVGRKQRTVSTPLKRALLSRDRGRTIPRCGYRVDDFTDDDAENPSAEGFRTTMGQRPSAEAREPAAVYR